MPLCKPYTGAGKNSAQIDGLSELTMAGVKVCVWAQSLINKGAKSSEASPPPTVAMRRSALVNPEADGYALLAYFERGTRYGSRLRSGHTVSQPTKQLILLGIGHTNAHIVREWETDPIPDCELICISKFPTATYSGMLPGTLGEQFNDDEWRIDLASLCHRAGAKLILADTNGLNLKSGELLFENHPPVRFDALSIGVGSMPAGWAEHTDSKPMITIKPMQTFLQKLEERLVEVVEKSSRPIKVAVVGGGVASVEIAFCLLQRCERKNLTRNCSIEIYTSDDKVAGGMSPKSVRKIGQLLNSRGIQVTNCYRVTKVDKAGIENADGNHRDADVVIWATGAAAPPVLGKLGLKTDDRGFIATSEMLQSLSDPRIFAVGDSGTIVKSPSPKAGVYAVRQSPILSHNLRALFARGSMKRFEPQSDFLKLLNTGDGKALLEYGWLTAHGRWCWHLKTWIDKRFITKFQHDPA